MKTEEQKMREKKVKCLIDQKHVKGGKSVISSRQYFTHLNNEEWMCRPKMLRSLHNGMRYSFHQSQ